MDCEGSVPIFEEGSRMPEEIYNDACLSLAKGKLDEATALFKLNWHLNSHSKSLHRYAYILFQSGLDFQARALFKINWEKYSDKESLHNYGCMVYNGKGGYRNEKEGLALLKYNWENNNYEASRIQMEKFQDKSLCIIF